MMTKDFMNTVIEGYNDLWHDEDCKILGKVIVIGSNLLLTTLGVMTVMLGMYLF